MYVIEKNSLAHQVSDSSRAARAQSIRIRVSKARFQFGVGSGVECSVLQKLKHLARHGWHPKYTKILTCANRSWGMDGVWTVHFLSKSSLQRILIFLRSITGFGCRHVHGYSPRQLPSVASGDESGSDAGFKVRIELCRSPGSGVRERQPEKKSSGTTAGIPEPLRTYFALIVTSNELLALFVSVPTNDAWPPLVKLPAAGTPKLTVTIMVWPPLTKGAVHVIVPLAPAASGWQAPMEVATELKVSPGGKVVVN